MLGQSQASSRSLSKNSQRPHSINLKPISSATEQPHHKYAQSSKERNRRRTIDEVRSLSPSGSESRSPSFSFSQSFSVSPDGPKGFNDSCVGSKSLSGSHTGPRKCGSRSIMKSGSKIPVQALNPMMSYTTAYGTHRPSIAKQSVRIAKVEVKKTLKPLVPHHQESEDPNRHITIGHWARNDDSLADEPMREGPPQSGPGVMLNLVSTAQYEVWNFLPLNLWKQFHRPANIYFLFISILQTVEVISITNGMPSTLVPLIFVLFVTILKDGYEDYNRHKSDTEENNRIAHKLLTGDDLAQAQEEGDFEEGNEERDVPWSEVQVGDVITVHNREMIPADLVLLASSDPNGLLFVMTANLDGETNLKARHVHADMVKEGWSELIEGTLDCDLPNNKLENFDGRFTSGAGEKVSLSNKNVILRGCQLRNTDWVKGVVVYSGPETKIQMNSAQTPFKTSRLAVFTNRETYRVLVLQILLCLIGGIISGVWASKNSVKNSTYLWGNGDSEDAFMAGFLRFWSFILIFTNFVPISLLVTLDIVKFLQSFMMMWDLQMYHEIQDQDGNVKGIPMQVRCSDLNEELGLVDQVFSDKTGTLTCNVMEFRKCSVRGKSFGLGTTEIGRALLKRKGLPIPEEPKQQRGKKTPNVNFTDPDLWIILGDTSHELHRSAHLFFLSLALNHDVMPEHKNGEITYSASSPDEAALVYAAKHFGYFFKRREMEKITVEIDRDDVNFTVLHILEFSSDRKRSSVITEENGKYMMYCKGADNVIKARLSKERNSPQCLVDTEKQLLQYVDDGLRTLLVAFKEIPKQEYLVFARQLHEAETSITDREAKIEAVADKIERELELLGVTAIEDKLQKGVPECLTALREGGIKVWMLTGDKVGTAINIGYSCSLLTTEMQLLRLCVEDQNIETNVDGTPSKNGVEKRLEELRAEIKYCTASVFALVVDTGAVAALTEYELQDDFMELCDICRSVVCARVSPRQKATIVELVREASPEAVTLSIGDGANDVPMIQTAHVGIGIHGLEGQQAVNSSDFSIGQFAFLKRLLLVHGRWNYRRLCKVIKYMFYKNAVLVLPQWLYGFYSLFGGQAFYFDIFYQLFNVAFTALPIIGLGVMDQDVSDKVICNFPVFYRDGIERVFLNRRIFWIWMLEAASHALLIYFMMICAFGTSQWHKNGQDLGLFELGTMVYLIVVAIAQVRLMIETSNFTLIMILFYMVSLLLWWICWLTMSSWLGLGFQVYGSINVVTHTASFWFGVIFSVVICFVVSFLFEALQSMAFPRRNHIGREMMAGYINGKKIEDPLQQSEVIKSIKKPRPQPQASLKKIHDQHPSYEDDKTEIKEQVEVENEFNVQRTKLVESSKQSKDSHQIKINGEISELGSNEPNSFQESWNAHADVHQAYSEPNSSQESWNANADFRQSSSRKFTAVLPKIDDVENEVDSTISSQFTKGKRQNSIPRTSVRSSTSSKQIAHHHYPQSSESSDSNGSAPKRVASLLSNHPASLSGQEESSGLILSKDTSKIMHTSKDLKRPSLKAPRKSLLSQRSNSFMSELDFPMFLTERQPSFRSGAKKFRKGLSVMDSSQSKPMLGKKLQSTDESVFDESVQGAMDEFEDFESIQTSRTSRNSTPLPRK